MGFIWISKGRAESKEVKRIYLCNEGGRVEQGRTNVIYWLKFEDKKLVLPRVGAINKGVGAS